jgi:hypothetical protein
MDRKYFYMFAENIPGTSNSAWQIILGAFGSTGQARLALNIQNSRVGGSGFLSPTLATLEYDRWYALELEIQNNTPNVADGIARVWLDGVLLFERKDMFLNGNSEFKILKFNVGEQAQRSNFERMNEFRYWDNIAFADAYIGPIRP